MNITSTPLLDRPRDAERAPTTGGPATGAAPRPAAVWSPWVGRNWSATADEESRFTLDLAALAGGAGDAHTRSDVTAVLNALRCGLTLSELLERAPGLRPARLAAAYADLAARRTGAERAWRSIADHGTTAALVEHGPEAAKLVPALVNGLARAAAHSPQALTEAVERSVRRIATVRRHVERIEDALARRAASPALAAELGRLLYGPSGDAVVHHPDFLPERVGLLVPTRVAALLGERAEVVGFADGAGRRPR